MAANFEGALEITGMFRIDLEEASQKHLLSLEHHLISRTRFLCNVCSQEFTRIDNRRRHWDNIHGFRCCEVSNCKRTFSTRNELDIHQAEDKHYCVACLQDYHGRLGRHKCRPRPRLAQNLSDGEPDVSSIIYLGSPHSIRTASPMSSPGLPQRELEPDLNLCCNEQKKMYGEEPILDLDLIEYGRTISIMALAMTFAFNGPENLTSKIIDEIVKNGIRYDTWCSEQFEHENLQQRSHAIVQGSPYASETYIEFNEDLTGDCTFDSFKDSFELFCLNCRYGICTVAYESVALVLTDETLYMFTFEMDYDNEGLRRPCVITHPRSSCLPNFLFEYFASVCDESFYYFSDQKFTFQVLDIYSHHVFVI